MELRFELSRPSSTSCPWLLENHPGLLVILAILVSLVVRSLTIAMARAPLTQRRLPLGSVRDAEDVRRGRQRDPHVREAEPDETLYREAGAFDRRRGVTTGMTAAAEGRPDRGVEQPLDPFQAGRAGTDVLEEVQMSAGPDDAVHLPQGPLLISDRAQHE
jgi:hypothetical protein